MWRHCETCGAMWLDTGQRSSCPKCGSADTEIIDDDETLLGDDNPDDEDDE